MNLGAFSISLNVKDLKVSKEFYQKLGFGPLGDFGDQGWAILKNGDHVIGLFQAMFEKNILTFNPGWDQSAQNVDGFTDIRKLRDELISRGITPVSIDTPNDSGPGSLVLEDPDGNPILIDQHR